MATQNANQELLDTILAKAKAKDASGQQDLAQFTAKSQAFAAAAKKVGVGGVRRHGLASAAACSAVGRQRKARSDASRR